MPALPKEERKNAAPQCSSPLEIRNTAGLGPLKQVQHPGPRQVARRCTKDVKHAPNNPVHFPLARPE
jgi:hypothetical protein